MASHYTMSLRRRGGGGGGGGGKCRASQAQNHVVLGLPYFDSCVSKGGNFTSCNGLDFRSD